MINRTVSIFAGGLLAVALVFAGASYAHAQTTGTGGTGTGTTGTIDTTTGTTGTVGVPNTGFGGNAASNIALLLTSGFIAVGGTTLLARNKKYIG